MSELTFEKSEFKSVIDNIVPQHQRTILTKMLEMETATEADFNDIGMSITGEKRQSHVIIYTGAPCEARSSMWACIKAELYDYLCTSSSKYKKERTDAGVTIKTVITIVATAIGSHFNVAMGVVVGAVTVALMSALKIGKNAWCEANKSRVTP